MMKKQSLSKLNLGCGNDIKKGFINLDSAHLPGVDIVHDLKKPLPFKDAQFDLILCRNILEHIDDYISVLKECFRVLKKNGQIHIEVPHFTSRINYIDPTHKKMFSIRTFEFFVKDSAFRRNYYFDFAFSKLTYRKICFEKGIFFYDYLVELIVNAHFSLMNLYEATFLSRLFPAYYIIIELEK
jgi:ubiquinone/menaquinone biosynthesis C-methylase UbiE